MKISAIPSYCKRSRLFPGLCLVIMLYVPCSGQTFQWAKGIGGSGPYQNLNSLCITGDAVGNSYTVGTFGQTVDFDPGPGVFNMSNLILNIGNLFILKLDSSGNFVWAKSLEGVGPSKASSITLDLMGNLLITGSFGGQMDFDPDSGVFIMDSPGSMDIFILKLNNNGQFIWAKSMGGIHSDDGRSIQIDGAGNIYTTGSFRFTTDFDPGPGDYLLTASGIADIFVLKLNSNGDFIWAKRMGGTDYNYANDLKIDSIGNVYVTGLFKDSVDFDPGPGILSLVAAPFFNAFVTKLDATGNLVWAKNLTAGGESEGKSIGIDNSGGVYVCGYFRHNADFDPGIATFFISAIDSLDIFLTKLNNDGDLVWARQFGGIGNEGAFDLAMSENAHIIFTGNFTQSVDFDPGSGIYNLMSFGQKDIFISELDSTGSLLWAKQAGGTNFDHGESIALIENGGFFVTGVYGDTINMNPPFGSILAPNGDYNVFFARFDTDITGLQNQDQVQKFSLFPNPAVERFSIHLVNNHGFETIQMHNISGCMIKTVSIRLINDLQIPLNDVSPGIYEMRFLGKNQQQSKKLVVIK